MSRKYNIRWQQSDNEQLTKAVKNFNAKIRRLEKKNPDIKNVLPEKISVRQMKELIETRQDLKRELNALKRFSKRGSEEVVTLPDNDYKTKTTKWQKQEMTRRVAVINRKRKKKLEELKEIEQTLRGESLGYTKGDIGMGRQEEIALKPMNAFTKKMNRKDLNFKFKNIMKESQLTYWDKSDLTLKENYIRSLEENFQYNDIKAITDKIRDMNMKDFKAIYYAEGGNFEMNYPGDKEEEDKNFTYLNSVWKPDK